MINNKVIDRLKEREKELKTLYRLNELLTEPELSPDVLFKGLIGFLAMGYQHTTICEVKVTFEGSEWLSDDFKETPWMLTSDIVIDNNVSGQITICYTQLIHEADTDQFMPEEHLLLHTITSRISNYFFQQRLENSLKLIQTDQTSGYGDGSGVLQPDSNQHWKWRFRIATRISELMDMEQFGVEAVYLIGSTKNATAGPASDIDLLIHHHADESQLNCLKSWLNGWSLCLAEENFERTGHQTHGLIDHHLITDDDIRHKSSFAVMIGAVNDPARLLRSRNNPTSKSSL